MVFLDRMVVIVWTLCTFYLYHYKNEAYFYFLVILIIRLFIMTKDEIIEELKKVDNHENDNQIGKLTEGKYKNNQSKGVPSITKDKVMSPFDILKNKKA